MEESIQPSNEIFAGCSLGNRFARVILYKMFDSANNVLLARLPAPVEQRQFVDDLTTMSVVNNDDDVTRSICSVALELRHELEAAKFTLNKNKSMIVSNRRSLANRVQRILRVNDLHIHLTDATRDLGIDAAGGARRRRSTRSEDPKGKAARQQRKSTGSEKPQRSEPFHVGNLAVHRVRGGAVRPVANRPETVPSHSSIMRRSWRTSKLPSRHC